MSQFGPKLRRSKTGYIHWCEFCDEIHVIPTPRWSFNENKEKPTFAPSVRLRWTEGHVVSRTEHQCHYTITDGEIQYHGDCLHGGKGLNNQGTKVPLKDLPADYCDPTGELGPF